MLQAFIDDSTSNIGDKSLFLAGYINTTEMWEEFDKRWEFTLKQDPPIEYLKMSEAEAMRGQFAGWSRENRDQKILDLAKIIQLSAPHFFFCRVSARDYNEIISDVAPYNLKIPYFAAFWGVIDTVARYCQHDENRLPVEFIFDVQEGAGPDAALFYQWIKSGLDPSLQSVLAGTPVFRDDKTTLAIQSADMLAWHLRRDHERIGAESRQIYDLMTERGVGRAFEREQLADIARKMKRVPGVRYLQTKSDWRRTRASTIPQIHAGLGPPSTNQFWMQYIHIRHLLTLWWTNCRYRKSRRD